MIRKRLVGVVTVREGWAVQSFGYRRYLPLGRPEILVENLDRWGADEIMLQCIDRSPLGIGPDLEVLERISRQGISTPLIYAGGIRDESDAISVIKCGADRVCVDALLHDSPGSLKSLSTQLGAQAIIACFPLALKSGKLVWLDYRSGCQKLVTPEVIQMLEAGLASEAIVVDWTHEGTPQSFNTELVARFPANSIPLIAFGGISDASTQRELFNDKRISAVAIGNFLNYREHSIHFYKSELYDLPLRPSKTGVRS